MAGVKSPITIESFKQHAKDLIVKIETPDGKVLATLVASRKVFHSGAVGWGAYGKYAMVVGEDAAQVQMGANLTIVGTKSAEGPLNLNVVRALNGKEPIELDETGHAPAKKSATPPVINKKPIK